MNFLCVGFDQRPILEHVPNDGFLLVDDGPIADAVISSDRTVRQFDPVKDSFNLLKDIEKDVRRAREIAALIEASAPGGETTLTYRYARDVLLDAMLAPSPRGKRLSDLFHTVPDIKDTGGFDAYLKVKDILRSPVLKRALEGRPPVFSLSGTIVARINRATLGPFDARLLGRALIANYPGLVIVPEFGFYALKEHEALVEQDRLVAGVTSLDEVPDLAQRLLQIPDKVGSRCTYDDASLLAKYDCPFPPHTDGFDTFIKEAMHARQQA